MFPWRVNDRHGTVTSITEGGTAAGRMKVKRQRGGKGKMIFSVNME
jgi:hypothetical protein